MLAFFRGEHFVTVWPSAWPLLLPGPVVHHEHILHHRADQLDEFLVGRVHEVGIAVLFRPERDQVAVLEPLVKPLGAVVRPLLERLDFGDFLFQRGKRLLYHGDLRLGRLGLVLETDKVPELLRLLFVRRLSGHTRVQHPQPDS